MCVIMSRVKILFVMVLFPFFLMGQKMSNKKIDQIIRTECDSIEGIGGAWQFELMDRPMFCFTDESNNRMRIICPIAIVEKLDEEMIYDAMIANFHSALDVKYAISDDVMWSVFIHPLKELSTAQFKDALKQVYNAAESFGTTYASTDLIFPGNRDSAKKNEPPLPAKKM